MCACDEPDLSARTAFDPGLIERARAIATRLGHRLPDEAWLIYFGLKGGAISWPDLCAVKRSYDMAALAARMTHARRRRGARFACDGVPAKPVLLQGTAS